MRYLFAQHNMLPGVFYNLPPGERVVVEAMARLEVDESGLLAELDFEEVSRSE